MDRHKPPPKNGRVRQVLYQGNGGIENGQNTEKYFANIAAQSANISRIIAERLRTGLLRIFSAIDAETCSPIRWPGTVNTSQFTAAVETLPMPRNGTQ